MKKGTCVSTKVGIGKVRQIDVTTYSIPLVIVDITKGKNKGEKVALIESQVKKVRKC